MTDELKDAAPSSGELELDEQETAAGGDKPGSEGDKKPDPLHLHPRFKELVGEKNQYKQVAAQYEALGAPTELAQKLARLEILEEMVANEPEKPKTSEEEAEAAKSAWARRQLEKLLPEIGKIKDLEAALEKSSRASTLYETAIAEIAWDTTVELAEELDMGPDSLAQLTIPIIKGDKKLKAKYDSGRSDEAVKGAVKILREKVAKTGGDIQERAKKLKEGDATKGLPKTHAPGKPEPSAAPSKPKTPEEANAAVLRRLDGMKW